MITLLHGDNVEASRAEFFRAKSESKEKEIREVDGKHLDASSLTQALESSSLFGGETLVCIENLFSSLGKKLTVVKEYAKKISASQTDILLWEGKEIGKTAIEHLGKNVTIRLFKTPVIIFKFLDALKPNQASVTIPLFEQLVQIDAPELVFSMMVRRIRQLIELSDNVMPEGLQSWQAKGLTNQARLFTMDKLLAMHKKFLESEYSLKSGASPFTMRQLIEQFLIDM